MSDHLHIPEIPQGFIEYRTTFKDPIFTAWFSRQALLQDIYHVLQPWGIDLEKVSGNENPRNLKEAQITFAVPVPAVLVTIGIGGLTIVANNADWSEASALISLFQTVLENVLRVTNAAVGSHETVLGFHLKPGPKPFRDIMSQFVNAEALGVDDYKMLGVGLYGPNHSLIMDNSAVLSGGLFVKITRVFAPGTGFEEMASILWKDEEGLLRRLGFGMEQ